MKKAKTQTLRKFLETRFFPARLNGCEAASNRVYATAIARFGRLLDRDPTLSDFTPENLVSFTEWLHERHTTKSVEDTVNRFRMIWKFAVECHLVAVEAPKMPRVAKLRPSLWEVEPLANNDRSQIVTLRDFAVQFYIPLRLTGKSHAAVRLYETTLNNFERFLQREPVFSDLTDDTIRRFMSWMVSRGRAAITANDGRNRLMALARLAARKRFILEEPEVMLLTEPTRTPMAWTRAELAILWAALEREPGFIAGVPANHWWVALHEVIWWSGGERVGAVLGLRWDDLADGWLTVRAELRKGSKTDRSMKFPPNGLAALERIRLPKRDLIFPWDRAYVSIWTRYGQILKRAGLPHGRKSKFHRIRKSAASHFKAAGGNATELLDHSSTKVTLSYLDPRIVTAPQAVDLLFSPGAKGAQQDVERNEPPAEEDKRKIG